MCPAMDSSDISAGLKAIETHIHQTYHDAILTLYKYVRTVLTETRGRPLLEMPRDDNLSPSSTQCSDTIQTTLVITKSLNNRIQQLERPQLCSSGVSWLLLRFAQVCMLEMANSLPWHSQWAMVVCQSILLCHIFIRGNHHCTNCGTHRSA